MSARANRELDLIVNIPQALSPDDNKTDGFKIRRLAIDHHIPLITNLHIAQMFLQCLAKLDPEKMAVRSLNEYISGKGQRG